MMISGNRKIDVHQEYYVSSNAYILNRLKQHTIKQAPEYKQ